MNKQSIIDRFEKNFIKEDNSCWLWSSAKIKTGYGIFYKDRKNKAIYAHRFSFELYKGPIVGNNKICHSCDNPSCVNPEHLWQGSQKDNLQDMYKKKRNNQPRGATCSSSKLTEKDVLFIREQKRLNTSTQKELSVKFGVAESTISRLLNGEHWRSI